MELKDQVCSLDLAKRLKELGVPQNSLWWWVKDKVWKPLLTCTPTIYKDKISAFTTSELGELLPEGYITFKIGNWKCIKLNSDNYFNDALAKTETNARAKMLVYLLENKLIKL